MAQCTPKSFDLTGKVALITGASYGIGMAIAKAMAANGATIVFNDIKQELVDKGLASYAEAGIKAHGYVCDVTDEDAVNAMVAKITEEVGHINILVNNAGIIKRIPMCEMTAAQFRQVIDVDLNAPFIVAKAIIPDMIEQGGGKIINICSMMSELGRETVSAYAAAKGGLKMLTRNMLIYGLGGVNDCVKMAEDGEAIFGWKNMCTTMMNNPLACDGYKTIAYEAARSMKFEAPDYVICPVGGGIVVSKVYKGYEEMYELGMIDHLPKMIAVQAAGCAPLVKAYDEGKKATEKWENGDTIAFAIFDPVTFEGVTALDTVRRSGGRAVAIPDDKILDAMRACAKMEAVIPEPASAATIAAAVKLHEDGVIGDDDRVVCVLTGSGLRDLKLFNNENADIPSVKPGDMDSLKQAVEHYQK